MTRRRSADFARFDCSRSTGCELLSAQGERPLGCHVALKCTPVLYSVVQTTIRVATDERLQTVEITDRVADCVPNDCDAGTCHVFVRHTTAGVLVNEDEPRLRDDVEDCLADLVPDSGHRHDDLDGNADSHLRAALVGPDATIPIRDGDLALGTWQSIFLLECDGPRERELAVTVTAAE